MAIKRNHPVKYWLSALVVLLASAFLFYFRINLFRPSARLTIYFSGSEARTFEGSPSAGMTMLEALNAASSGGGFGLRYSLSKDNSVNLASISNFVNAGEKSWHFFLDTKPVLTADINRIKIGGGDIIEVKYEK